MALVRALTDLRFDHLISRHLLGVVYAIALGVLLLVGVIAAIAWVMSGGVGVLLGLLALVVTALLALGLRVTFEVVAVYFRAAEDLRALRERQPL